MNDNALTAQNLLDQFLDRNGGCLACQTELYAVEVGFDPAKAHQVSAKFADDEANTCGSHGPVATMVDALAATLDEATEHFDCSAEQFLSSLPEAQRDDMVKQVGIGFWFVEIGLLTVPKEA